MFAGRAQHKRISMKKEVIQMAETIEKVPAETRWEGIDGSMYGHDECH
jgi:hypothetical protein